MTDDGQQAPLSEQDYARIAERLARTERGRRFLEMRDRAVADAARARGRVLAAEDQDRLAALIAEVRRVCSVLQESAHNILSAADQIQTVAPQADREVMEIVTACSFHDEGGQRLARVEDELHNLDEELRQLGIRLTPPRGGNGAGDDPDGQGPSDDGMDQDEIDRLLNDD